MPKAVPVLKVFIPTRGRVGLNLQVTLRQLCQLSSIKPFLVCPPDETERHCTYYDRVLPCPLSGIGPTRQWIMENAGTDYVCVLSDDLRFSYRPDPASPKLELCTDLDPMFDTILGWMRGGVVHGGVSARQGNNHKDCSKPRNGVIENGHVYVDCDRVNDFHFFNPKACIAHEARWDALPVMEDFHFTLGLLTKGVPNRVMYDYVWNQEASGKAGGCSLYRTPQVQAAGAEGLRDAFPDFVKVVTKTSKDTSGSWKDFKERKDVIIQWWRAWQSSQSGKQTEEVGTLWD